MSAAPQGLKGWNKYFRTGGQSGNPNDESTPTAVGVIIDTVTNSTAALMRHSGGDSIIGPELHVSGTLMCFADVTIQGTLIGDIRAKAHVTIGESGVVLGNIYAEEVTVRGRMEGTLNAQKVRLCRSCHVKGEVVHGRLEVEHGAFFEGDCGHSENPAGEWPVTSQ